MSAKQKYFLAIIPPEPVFSQAETIKKDVSVKYNNKSALRSPAHITLHMPFEWELKKESLLIDALNKFKFNQNLTLRLKNYGCFEPKVVFIDVERNQVLNDLQKSLIQHVKTELGIFNESDNLRAYHPHLTIAFRDLKKSDFYLMMEEYRTKQFDAEFTTHQYCLLKHTGKIWEIFRCFDL